MARPLERADSGKALQGELLGDLGVTGDERTVLCWSGDELQAEAFGVLEPKPVALDRRFEAG